MKKRKLLATICLALSTIAATAQDWDFSSGRSSTYESTRHHHFGIDIGIGGSGNKQFIGDFGLRWQININDYIAWDALTVKSLIVMDEQFFSSDEDESGYKVTPQLLSGIHLLTPQFSGMKVYGYARLGYGWNIHQCDEDYVDVLDHQSGFAYELGAGLQVSKHVYLGYAFNKINVDYGAIYTPLADSDYTDESNWKTIYYLYRAYIFRVGFVF